MTKTQPEMAAHDQITWKLFGDAQHAGSKVYAMRLSVQKLKREIIGDQDSNVVWKRRYAEQSRERLSALQEHLIELVAAEKAAADKLAEHEKSYEDWARFWCVPNGHIHSSRSCSTCNKMGKPTEFYLAHEVSGMDEEAAVKAQGPLLCTVCFPSAPLDWTNGLDEAAKAKKAAQCDGSGKSPAKNNRPYARYQPCSVCKTHQSVTSRGSIRAHKPPAEKK
jgi:hypothetical protein